MVAIDFHYCFSTLEVNGHRQLFDYHFFFSSETIREVRKIKEEKKLEQPEGE